MSGAPVQALQQRQLRIEGEAAMLDFGAACGRSCLESGPVIAWLQGDLGAGKTTLARGWLRGMGYQGRVKSPTYTLLEPYELEAGQVLHLDLYRLAGAEELEFLGLRDLSDGAASLLIEWPERGRGHLPACDLRVQLQADEQGRDILLQACSGRGEQWLASLERKVTLK